ncbi:MAG: elongation factor Ts [Patescibacteria group bacterium]|jgi:elongation factor Ts|nr:elongation factor Ts [Patescibacteria group bacterium]
MAQANIELLKKLRAETSASIADCRAALEETENEYDKAKEWLKKRGLEKAEKKSDRETSQGVVEAYIHNGAKVGVLIVLTCETDFVAKTDEFKALARELCMHIAAMNPESVDDLLKQAYIRDAGQTIEQVIKSVIGKIGENITVREFKRLAI